MSSRWNFRDPLRCGFVRIARAGHEKYGTVIKSGYMKKTITVRVNAYVFNSHYKLFHNKSKKIHVHDEYELGKVSDKVVIRTCNKLSKHKHYYLKNFVWMSPRQNFVIKDYLYFEKAALVYNERLRSKSMIGVKTHDETELKLL